MKKCLITIVLVIMPFHVFAADISTPLPKKCEAFRPDILYSQSQMLLQKDADKLMNSRDYGQMSSSRGESGHEFWIVFSDRADNPTYVAPGSKTQYKKLDFNEKVRIAQIQDGYALVYTEPKEQETYPRFSSEIEWKGWVPMSKLLLWNTCPVNDHLIYNKAMLCANIDEDISNDRVGKLFKNPDNLKQSTGLSVDFNYYFVMKNEKDMVLLATQNTMQGTSYRVLYGWVDKNSFVAWNQRSCLEPTWEIEDVEFFAKNGIKVNITDEVTKKKASYIAFQKKSASSTYDPYMYRMNGTDLRYPILDNTTADQWNCSTFSSPGGNGAINAANNSLEKATTQLRHNMDALAKVNFVIVIDGTKSMERYFPAVRETLKEINAYFSSDTRVKVGVLIYRDKHDGDYVTEMVPLTNPDNPKLAEWLNSGGSYGIKSSSSDRTMQEAVLYGINKALDSFNFNPEESNMMFVIGDCGDAGDYPEITAKVITQKLVDKNVTLMGFQVRNESDPAFPLFNNNMCDLILGSLQDKFSKLNNQVVVKAQLKKDEYEFNNNAKNFEGDLYVGSHRYVQSGQLSVDELKSQIINSVVKVKGTVQHQIDIMNDVANGASATSHFSGNSEVTGPQLDEAWLEARVGKDWLQAFKRSNTTVSFRGFVPKTDQSSARDYFKTVIFISQQELNTLMIRLTPLNEVAQRKGNDREPYVKALKALVQSMVPGISDAEMNAMGYDEIMGMVAGLNASTMTLKGRTITEIASTKAVNATEYQSIIAKFKRQYQKLQRIQKQPYKYVREFNGAKYYWIPTEDLP